MIHLDKRHGTIAALLTALTLLVMALFTLPPRAEAPVTISDPVSAPHASAVTTVGSPETVASKVTAASNVVVILADDMDWKLWREIPRLVALQARGTTFTNYTVADSLCCPSRTSIFRSQYVHNHQVLSNDLSSGGGWPTFRDKGYPADSLPTWLNAGGVTSALVGKYLNQFPYAPDEATMVPPGWNDFIVPTSKAQSYAGYGYQVDDNGVVVNYGSKPADFLNDVLDTKASEFVRGAPNHFFLELASYTPHLPSPAAPRHLGSHAGAVAPRDMAYDTSVTNPPTWLVGLPPLGPRTVRHLDRMWQSRAESAESVADSVDSVMKALEDSGHAADTLVRVTSDNGFHVGSYRTHDGKRSAFDVDTVVPFVAIGPSIPAGAVVSEMTSEIDLAPTIADVFHAKVPTWTDGRSLLPLLNAKIGSMVDKWRTGVLSESLGEAKPGDPDFQLIAPPSFAALRTKKWLYVEYENGERELYDRSLDPFEINNVVGSTSPQVIAPLHDQLQALKNCAGPECSIADSMPNP